MDKESIDDDMEAVREACRKVRLARSLKRQPLKHRVEDQAEDPEDEVAREKVQKALEDIRQACHDLALVRGQTLQQQLIAEPYRSVDEKVKAISKVYTYHVTEVQIAKRKERRASGRRVSFSEPLATIFMESEKESQYDDSDDEYY